MFERWFITNTTVALGSILARPAASRYPRRTRYSDRAIQRPNR